MIANSCPWLNLTTEGGLSRLLKRLRISYKRGREYIHSPDRRYVDKLSLIELCRLRAFYAPERFVFLYLDEMTYYRQPSVACTFEAAGSAQALARRSHHSNTWFRVIGTLNSLTGQVIYRQRSQVNRFALSKFWTQVRDAYPTAPQGQGGNLLPSRCRPLLRVLQIFAPEHGQNAGEPPLS